MPDHQSYAFVARGNGAPRGGRGAEGNERRLGSIAIVVSDAKKSAKWYKEKLGLEIKDHEGHWVTVAPRDEDVRIHLCEEFYPLEPGNSGIAFYVKDVAKEEKALKQRGVNFSKPTQKEEWGTYAMFKDPDGNEFWLFEE